MVGVGKGIAALLRWSTPPVDFVIASFALNVVVSWHGGRVKSARTTDHYYHMKTPCAGAKNPIGFLRAEGAQEQQQNATTCDRT